MSLEQATTTKKRRTNKKKPLVEPVEQREVVVTERDETEVEEVNQLHPCTWCGGFKHKTVKNEGTKEVVVGLLMPAVVQKGSSFELSNSKAPYMVCYKCLYRVFNDRLGQARYHGNELAHLREEVANKKQLFPARADGM